MLDILFFLLIFIACLDVRLLRKYDADFFRGIFHLPKGVVLLFLFVLGLVAFPAMDRAQNIFLLILVSVFPWYLLKRDQFSKSSSLNVFPPSEDQKKKALIWSHRNFKSEIPIPYLAGPDKPTCPADSMHEFRCDPAKGGPKGDNARAKRVLIWYSDALGVILWWAFYVFTVGFVFKRVGGLFFKVESELLPLIILTFLSLMIMLTLIYQAAKKFPGQDFLTKVGLRRDGNSRWKVFLLPVAIGLLFAVLSANIIVTHEIQPETPLSEILESTSSLGPILVFLIVGILLAPLLEEIIFRGYFYYVLSQRKGAVFAIYVVALSFGFLHVDQYWGDWLAVGMVMALGFVLTLLRAWTGSTLASVVTHYAYNGGVTILTIILFAVSNPSYFEYKMNMDTLNFAAKERLLEDSLAKQPHSSEIRNDLAILYVQENTQLEEALKLIEGALQRHPYEHGYLDTKAEILYKLGRYEEALKIREDLLKKKISQRMKEHQRKKIEETKEPGGELP